MTAAALERLEAMYTQALAAESRKGVINSISRELDPRLHAYQCEAVAHLHRNAHAALFLEMGRLA